MEELSTIDTSVVEALERATAELETLEKRLQKLEERRNTVSQQVYERVHGDYESRKASLEEEIAPLAEKAQNQYATVKESLEQLEDAAGELALEKEELQLRQELGEYSEEEYAGRLQEIEEKIEENATKLAEARRLRDLFVVALREEPDAAPDAENSSTQPLLEPDEAHEADLSAPQAVADEFPPGDETPARPPALRDEPLALEESLPETGPGPIGTEDYVADATVFIQWPKLVGQAADGSTVEYPVAGSRTTLGRDPENDIVLSGKKVSKHHAEILLVEDGYEIRDLESTAGTLVNGVQITSWKLSNGDSVQLGDVVLVFMES